MHTSTMFGLAAAGLVAADLPLKTLYQGTGSTTVSCVVAAKTSFLRTDLLTQNAVARELEG